eukprot:1104212-Heterocapsa_arctica.AAC.1
MPARMPARRHAPFAIHARRGASLLWKRRDVTLPHRGACPADLADAGPARARVSEDDAQPASVVAALPWHCRCRGLRRRRRPRSREPSLDFAW